MGNRGKYLLILRSPNDRQTQNLSICISKKVKKPSDKNSLVDPEKNHQYNQGKTLKAVRDHKLDCGELLSEASQRALHPEWNIQNPGGVKHIRDSLTNL